MPGYSLHRENEDQLLDELMQQVRNKEKIDERSMWQKIADWAQARSIYMLHYCTGCGAIELPPTMTSRFDMERFGIGPMATPRQADVLLITGYLAAKTLRRVILTYEQMQTPKFVMGFGSCTLNGGIYYDSYSTIQRLDLYLPVDLYIAGCMPRPEAIIMGFNRLKQMISSGDIQGWKDYEKRHDWYRKNQDKALKGEVYVTR